jgi:hypothetical protein
MGTVDTRERRRVGNVAFTVESLDVAIADVIALATHVNDQPKPTAGVAVHFANAYNVALARSDAEEVGPIPMSQGLGIACTDRT